MAAWVISALRLLASGIVIGAGAEGATRLIPGGLGHSGIPEDYYRNYGESANMVEYGPQLSSFGIPPHPHKRRRRKRALTASDRADIAFIAGLLGPAAGGKFAAIIGAK